MGTPADPEKLKRADVTPVERPFPHQHQNAAPAPESTTDDDPKEKLKNILKMENSTFNTYLLSNKSTPNKNKLLRVLHLIYNKIKPLYNDKKDEILEKYNNILNREISQPEFIRLKQEVISKYKNKFTDETDNFNRELNQVLGKKSRKNKRKNSKKSKRKSKKNRK